MISRAIIVMLSMLYALTGFYATPAFAASIIAVSTEYADGRTTVRVQYDSVIDAPNIFPLGGDAPRIVIDVEDTLINAGAAADITVKGAVTGIRHAARNKGTRLVLDISTSAKLDGFIHNQTETIIEVKGSGAALLHAAATTQPSNEMPTRTVQRSVSGVPVPRLKPVSRKKPNRKPVIVIDAGHGGYDPGAIGGGGTHEKDVTLKAARQLKELLVQTRKYEVVLTREKDVYVIHDERVRRARAIDADLFISIHADSLDSNRTRGASVYTLADHAHKRSTKLVDRQNWIMDVDLTKTPDSVDDILVDLAQRKTFSNSDKFAEILVPKLAQVTPILGNTHRRAGLAVLLAPDVPAILLEMGFLSNAQDERALNSAGHREKLMGAVVKSIGVYFSE